MKYCIGIDIGGTTIKHGIFTENGELINKYELPTRCGENGKYIFSDIADGIRAKLAELQIELSDVIGAGMGIPGPVLADGYVNVCVNLGISSIYPGQELSRLLDGMEVKVSNDANVAALGELWQGAGKGKSSVCMVTLGTGVGGGIVINGKIVDGALGAGGEIGHICMNPMEEESCNCGGKGCLEQYASATGIARVARRMLASSGQDSELRKFENITAKDVCDLAKSGDELAYASLRKSMNLLGLALQHVSMCVDPEVFVIGGGVSKAGEFLTDMIEEEFVRYNKLTKTDYRRVLLAKLGNDAGIYGCAKMVL
ncbi:MAG: ROK family glucokinase [Eubacteriales bacterium]|nr:ROK family glucokinase [Eubacteriales bacterium]